MLNQDFIKRMGSILGENDLRKYLDSFNQKPSRAFHINTKKVSPDNFLELFPFDTEPIPFLENSYYFDVSGIGNHPYHHAGMFYIQEPAAMFPIGSINIKPDWKILDMCASPGGKSSQAMQYLSNEGQLVSNEIIPSRCKTLCGNFERLGYTNATVTCADSNKISQIYENYFDLVIVDAPCSGEGMFRKDPTAISEWSNEHVISCAKRQETILNNAAKCVVSGGYILYSTCTFSPEENELTIKKFIENNPNFKPVPLKSSCYNYTAEALNIDNNNYHSDCMRRFYPHISKGEGQFAALLQNTDDINRNSISKNPFRKPNPTENKIILDFLSENITDFNTDDIFINKDNIILCDSSKFYPNGSYLCGITVGLLQKNHIKPHHQFFSAMGNKFIRKINFSSESSDLDYYLHGGSFHINAEKGLSVVMVDNVALGGCKIVDGYLKNHYPKGLHLLK